MTLGSTVAATQGTRTASAARGVAAPSGRASERDVKGLWQTVSAALIGAILAGAGSWLTFTRSITTSMVCFSVFFSLGRSSISTILAAAVPLCTRKRTKPWACKIGRAHV